MKRTSRKPSKLSSSLQRHLNGYSLAASAAGVGILALTQPAEAEIIYTKTNVKILLHEPLGLDLDNDGYSDFLFENTTCSCNGRFESVLQVQWLGTQANEVVEQFRGSHYLGAAALKAGKTIGPHHHFGFQRVRMADDCSSTNCPAGFLGPWANGGKGVQNRYLGVEFKISGQTHYGWARLSVSMDRGRLHIIVAHLTGYAYETIPNKPIIAGKTKGPDVITVEPGSLGALAAGAAGRSGK